MYCFHVLRSNRIFDCSSETLCHPNLAHRLLRQQEVIKKREKKNHNVNRRIVCLRIVIPYRCSDSGLTTLFSCVSHMKEVFHIISLYSYRKGKGRKTKIGRQCLHQNWPRGRTSYSTPGIRSVTPHPPFVGPRSQGLLNHLVSKVWSGIIDKSLLTLFIWRYNIFSDKKIQKDNDDRLELGLTKSHWNPVGPRVQVTYRRVRLDLGFFLSRTTVSSKLSVVQGSLFIRNTVHPNIHEPYPPTRQMNKTTIVVHHLQNSHKINTHILFISIFSWSCLGTPSCKFRH